MKRFIKEARQTWNQWLGRRGENIARSHLRGKGYRILHTRYRTPYGEIDIVAKRGDLLTFVEVKTRGPGEFSDPFEAITAWKLNHMKKAAHCFLLENKGYRQNEFVLEVVAIRKDGRNTDIAHITLEL